VDSSAVRRKWVPLALVFALAALHLLLANFAARGNSSTFDEPVHAVAARAVLDRDYSVNPEHPPVWKYIAALPLRNSLPPPDPAVLPRLRSDPVAQWPWAVGVLYGHDDPASGEAAIASARIAMSGFGALTILVAGLLAYRLAGPVAAVLAACLLTIDPLLLAHSPIVSNDVALTALLLATLYLAWELRRHTLRPVHSLPLGALLGVLCGLCLCTKFTGILAFPLSAGLLLIARKPRILPLLLALPAAYLTIWAAYSFRYAPAPDGSLIRSDLIAERVGRMRLISEGKDPLASPLPSPDAPTRFLLATEQTRLLPQSLTAGLLMSYGVTRSNSSYLLGQFSTTGWWLYFPFAATVKTPVGLLLILVSSLYIAKRRSPGPHSLSLALCLATLLLASMSSPLNIGLRHLLPVTTLAVVLAAAAWTQLWHHRIARGVVVALAVMAALESARAFPHYLSFFNAPARLSEPARLLADSNLDWGQDLARLATWRRDHPAGILHLAYWGTADPRAYGLTVNHLPGTWEFTSQSWTAEPGYIAVSVSYLQGYPDGITKPFYRQLLARPPLTRIGDSIWVWSWGQ
jgi:hypothetical protein